MSSVACLEHPPASATVSVDAAPLNSVQSQTQSCTPFQPLSSGHGPQIEPILALHRGADGFICFCRKNANDWENLASIRADRLTSVFPAFREELLRDSYYSVNAFWRDGGRNRKWPGLRAPYRETEGLRYLNACYVDLDCYKVGLDSGMLAGIVLSAQDNGLIPPVSILARSGRGVWLFWLLQDDRTPGQPPRYWPEKMGLYMGIQRALYDILAAYGADAFDAARVTRVPGSIHSGVNEPVTYLLQADARGRVFLHTLESMSRALGLPNPQELGPAKRRGWVALHAKRLRQFETLWSLRGTFSDGCRNHALLLYVTFVSKNGYPEGAIGERARRFGAKCRPPLANWEVEAAIKTGLKRHKFTDQKISGWLDIRPKEAAFLETWGPASRFNSPALPEPKELSRNDRMGARREAIRQILTEESRVPSVRKMVTLLRERCGITCSLVTVASDYQSLSIISESERKRRRRKQEAVRQLVISEPQLLSSHAGERAKLSPLYAKEVNST